MKFHVFVVIFIVKYEQNFEIYIIYFYVLIVFLHSPLDNYYY